MRREDAPRATAPLQSTGLQVAGCATRALRHYESQRGGFHGGAQRTKHPWVHGVSAARTPERSPCDSTAPDANAILPG